LYVGATPLPQGLGEEEEVGVGEGGGEDGGRAGGRVGSYWVGGGGGGRGEVR